MNPKQQQDGKRIILTQEVYTALESVVSGLKAKGDYFKVNEARLANVIIEIFCAKYLIKEQKKIEAQFFDKKSYLKTLIENSASEDDLSTSLSEFMQKSKIKKVKRSKIPKADQGEAIT